MSEHLPYPPDFTAAEMGATEALFVRLPLPPGSTRRRLSADDVAAYIAFDEDGSFAQNPTYAETGSAHEPERFQPEDITESMGKGDVVEGIFDPQGGLIATAWLKQATSRVLNIANLVVHPHYRNTRITGDYLLPAAEAIARVRGLEYCTLHVDPLNGPGLNRYIQQGYRAVGYETDSADGLDNWLIMAKPVSGWPEVPAEAEKPLLVSAGNDQGLATAVKRGYTSVGFMRGDSSTSNQIAFAQVAGQPLLNEIMAE